MRLLKSPSVLPGFSVSLGITVLCLSLLVVLPFTMMAAVSAQTGWQGLWQTVSEPRVLAAVWLTLKMSFLAMLANIVFGTLTAWVLVRYDFPGRKLADALVDLPFALPTAVAGLTLATLLSPGGWIGQLFAPWGIKIAYAFPGLVIAMIFTSIPFIVRTVQPVIEDLGHDVEEAAGTLGARPGQIFWRITLPTLVPALTAGASQAFIRSLGEFGAVVMIAGNIPFQTEITSLMIFVRLQEFDYAAAAAIASVVLITSLVLLFGLQLLQNRLLRWQRGG